MEGVDDVLKTINAMNLKEISNKVGKTLDALSQAVADADVKGISTSARRSLEKIEYALDTEKWDRILSSLDKAAASLSLLMSKTDRSLELTESSLTTVDAILHENRDLIHSTMQDLRLAVRNANHLMEAGSVLVEGSDEALSRLERYLVNIARNLERASANLERLTEKAADNPSQVLFGEPPPPRETRPGTP
jgi:hypothetical protein